MWRATQIAFKRRSQIGMVRTPLGGLPSPSNHRQALRSFVYGRGTPGTEPSHPGGYDLNRKAGNKQSNTEARNTKMPTTTFMRGRLLLSALDKTHCRGPELGLRKP